MGGTVAASRTIARPASDAPTTQTSFTDLAYGAYDVAIKAYPAADGSGVAQALGMDRMVVAENLPGVVTVSLASTVATLAITPENAAVDKGQPLDLTASAKDYLGNVVLLAAGGGQETLAWSLDAPTNATITGNGPVAILRTTHSGSVVVHASLTTADGGVTVEASVPVTIRPVEDGSGTVTVK